jgi:hypothetical protein
MWSIGHITKREQGKGKKGVNLDRKNARTRLVRQKEKNFS